MNNRSTTPKTTATDDKSASFKNMVDLLAIFSDATNRMEALENGANARFLEVLDEIRPEYAELQEALKKAEAAAEAVATLHPEWFTAKKSIKTPYGTVGFRDSTSLDVANEEASILLIRNASERLKERASEISGLLSAVQPDDPENEKKAEELRNELRHCTERALHLDSCIRIREELDKEALEKLDDATLNTFRIKRVASNNFQIKPAKINIGKAVKEAAESEAA